MLYNRTRIEGTIKLKTNRETREKANIIIKKIKKHKYLLIRVVESIPLKKCKKKMYNEL